MRDIKGYEGLYAITKNGRVWSYPKKYGKTDGQWLKPFIQSKKRVNGTVYSLASVGLRKNKKRKLFLVHRLIAETYIPNPEKKPQVNHINCNSLKNYVDNLEWATRQENMQHAYDNGLLNFNTKKMKEASRINLEKGRIACSKITRLFTIKQAKEIKRLWQQTKRSFASLGREFEVSPKTIANICYNKTYQFEI